MPHRDPHFAATAEGKMQRDALAADFESPPSDARPGVYWYFLDGNQDPDAMVRDLEAMTEVGIGAVLFLEVDLGVPRGPVGFMSAPWRRNFALAVHTCERLGMQLILGTGPGWAGAGGPWIDPDHAMQHLVAASIDVEGPGRVSAALPLPPPPTPNHFSGMTDEIRTLRDRWYRDVAVLAYPAPEGDSPAIELIDVKTLKETQPYSIWKHVPRYVPVTPPLDAGGSSHRDDDRVAHAEPGTVPLASIIDVSSRLRSDGTLDWDAPAGRWRVVRSVARITGQTSRPAPQPGLGLECDKFAADAFHRQWEGFHARLLEEVAPGKNGCGWTGIHLDSWEMSSQNWSARFREEFRERRGYDPLPYFPAYAGVVVGSGEITERFLFDMRLTAQELVLSNHMGTIRETAHRHGMVFSNEPYDMNPAGNLDLGSTADIPMGEFWEHRSYDTVYSCVEAVSIGHVMGSPRIGAESFTSAPPVCYDTHPARMKNQLDWAFALGINAIFFHTYQHQPLGDEHLPGLSFGPHGINWHRNQNWWSMLAPFHRYIARLSAVLRRGVAVVDILYLTPEGAPSIFMPSEDAMHDTGTLRDKKGYAFDAVSPRLLNERATVRDGRVAFPGGSAYHILVLPNDRAMRPETVATIERLVDEGATVVGIPPLRSPSLVDHPMCDRQVAATAQRVWESLEVPPQLTTIRFGGGTVVTGQPLTTNDSPDNLYPSYSVLATILASLGIPEDLDTEGAPVRFCHREEEGRDIYFVASRSADVVTCDRVFRVSGKRPLLYSPTTGVRLDLPEFTHTGAVTRVPLVFAPYESHVIVFEPQASDATTDAGIHAEASSQSAAPSSGPRPAANFPAPTLVREIAAPWTVRFDPSRGPFEPHDGLTAGEYTFDRLIDWTDHPDPAVRFYSGIARYTTTFTLTREDLSDGDRTAVDLGNVGEVARVSVNGTEVGVAWTFPWRVPLGSAAKVGENTIEVEVANSWQNRLVGDIEARRADDHRTIRWESGLLAGEPQSAGRFTFTTCADEQIENAGIQPSGLFGPVRVVRER